MKRRAVIISGWRSALWATIWGEQDAHCSLSSTTTLTDVRMFPMIPLTAVVSPLLEGILHKGILRVLLVVICRRCHQCQLSESLLRSGHFIPSDLAVFLLIERVRVKRTHCFPKTCYHISESHAMQWWYVFLLGWLEFV